MTFEEFHDPRLVTLSLTLDEGRGDLAFYLDLASRLQAQVDHPLQVVDLGCGTGELAVALAERGCAVTGVEPAPAMVATARQRPGTGRVRWVEGDASALGREMGGADLVTMTGHVAQVISDEAAWRATLASVSRILHRDGRLAFESRNPAARAWEHWTPERTRERVSATALGAVSWWWEVVRVDGELVTTEIHYVVHATGEELVSRNLLRFRPWDALSGALTEAGLEVEQVFGDWSRAPFAADSPEFVVLARPRQ